MLTQAQARKRKLTVPKVLGAIFALAILASIYFSPTGLDKIFAMRIDRLSNTKKLAQATIMYANDYDDFFPNMKSVIAFQPKILPYIKEKEDLIDPVSKQAILPNPALSSVNEADIIKLDEAVLIYAPLEEGKDKRSVGFADGHAKTIEENDFVTLIALTGTGLYHG